MISKEFLISARSAPKSGFWMLWDAFEVREAAGSVGFARERPASSRPLAEPSSGRFPGSWSPGFGLPGGCASSRLDHGLENPPGRLR